MRKGEGSGIQTIVTLIIIAAIVLIAIYLVRQFIIAPVNTPLPGESLVTP